MSSRKVLDVGNCAPDHAAICRMLKAGFDVEVLQAHGVTDALDILRSTTVDLVLINRKLDRDYSDGIEVLKLIKTDEDLQDTPVMLITNYAEHQQAAVSLGALPGFGKLEFSSPTTQEKLAAVLN
ncbi:MAG: response regulator [Planctomycetales bacterium]|nr:response regulator [Planctomycetales bacterium]